MEMTEETRTNSEELLLRGAELLKPLFLKHGFVFAPLGKGKGSGGRFAFGEFRKEDRRLEFHFRYSLGLVTYHLGSESISHEEYMCSVLGKPHLSQYPGFSDDPFDAFLRLREDLENYCDDFLDGTDDLFRNRIKDAHARWAGKPKLPG